MSKEFNCFDNQLTGPSMPFQRIPNKSTPAIVVSTTGNEYRQSHDNYVPNKRSRMEGLLGNCCRTPSGGWLAGGREWAIKLTVFLCKLTPLLG